MRQRRLRPSIQNSNFSGKSNVTRAWVKAPQPKKKKGTSKKLLPSFEPAPTLSKVLTRYSGRVLEFWQPVLMICEELKVKVFNFHKFQKKVEVKYRFCKWKKCTKQDSFVKILKILKIKTESEMVTNMALKVPKEEKKREEGKDKKLTHKIIFCTKPT